MWGNDCGLLTFQSLRYQSSHLPQGVLQGEKIVGCGVSNTPANHIPSSLSFQILNLWKTKLASYRQFSTIQYRVSEISMECYTHFARNFLQPLNCHLSNYTSSNNIAIWVVSIRQGCPLMSKFSESAHVNKFWLLLYSKEKMYFF